MKKNNKLLLLFLGIVMSIASLGMGACTKGGGEESSVIPTTPPAVEELKPSLTLNAKKITLPLFSRTTLVATLKNSTESIVWTSSDTSVVTVENGEIYGLKEGTATVTATAGTLSESCNVTVTKEGVTTEFAMLENGMTLYLDSPFQLDPMVVSNGVEVEGVTVTFATTGDVFTIDAEGNVTTLKEGEQQLTATAKLNGETILNATYTVKVREYLSIKTGIDKNTLQLKLTDYLTDSLTEYSTTDFKAIIGSKTRDDITLTYAVEDDEIVSVQNGIITPLKAGETTVSVSFISPNTQNAHTTNINVVVGKEIVAKSTDFLAKSATGTKKDDFQNNVTGVTSIDLSDTGIDLSTLTAVRENGKTLVANANGNTLIVTDASCGDVQLEVELEKVVYIIDGFIAQTIISNKTELQKFYTQYGSVYGYTVLTEDIDMVGETLNGGSQWFRCIFDGRGHTISNFTTPYGIVTYMSEGSLIKNVQYVNVIKDSGTATEYDKTEIGAFGLFGALHTGAISDVLIVGTIKNPATTQAVFCGGEYSQASYKNIVVAFDVENATNTTLVGTGTYYSGTGTKNVFDNVRYVYGGAMTTCADYPASKDALHYTSVSAYVETKDFDDFDGYWTTYQNALPAMSDLESVFENSLTITEGNFEAGGAVTVTTTMACSKIVLKNAVNGVTFDGKTLKIGANVALGTTITLVVSNSLNDVAIEKEYTVRATETLTYAGKYVDATNGKAKLDLSKLSKTIGEVQAVAINGIEYGCATQDGILTYDTVETGKLMITLITETCVYSVEVLQADNVITTAEQFTKWIHKDKDNFGSYKYTVLANDITFATASAHYMNSFPQGRVFDGLGHTIDGFASGMGIVHSLDGGTTTWKNVNYTNYSGVLVLYVALGGTFENVNVSGTVSDTGNLLVYTINRANTTVKNCVFNLNHKTAGTPLNLAKKGAEYNDITLIDTMIIYSNGQLTTNDLDLSKGSNYTLYDVDDITQTNYYSKVNGGTATFALSQMGDDAFTSVSKLLVNGVETTATVVNGVLSYPAHNTGATMLIITTNIDTQIMNIVHADNVITTWEEFKTWATTENGTYNTYEYTVLANDITASGTTYSNGGYFEKTFDGLGHTIDGFTCGHGIVQRLLAGSTWKNVNYTGLTTTGQGLFGYLAGGTFENVNINGALGSETYIFGYGINSSSTKFVNCTFTLTNADKIEKCVCAGSVHAYTITLVDSTVNYNGTVNYQTCTCTGTYGCSGAAAKITLTNSTINSNVK